MGLGFESSRAMDFLSSLSPNINVVEIVMEARVLVCTKEPFSFYPNVTAAGKPSIQRVKNVHSTYKKSRFH